MKLILQLILHEISSPSTAPIATVKNYRDRWFTWPSFL